MDRLTSVEWLRMKADGFYNVFEQERFLEAADEIERLRKSLVSAKECIDGKAYTAAVMIIDTALQQKESK